MSKAADGAYASIPKWLHRIDGWKGVPVIAHLSRALRRIYEARKRPFVARLHGFDVLLNPGNPYPLFLLSLPLFNAPLIELVCQLHRAKGRQLCLVDVGAAAGDTVFLLKERCPGQIGDFLCIEGDAEFFDLLQSNMRHFTDVTAVKALLARTTGQIRSLTKHHRGTAASLGTDRIQAMPLDVLPEIANLPIDVLKIDVDGFDGQVLQGARSLLRQHKPAVIFEWHPSLCVATGNDPVEAFAALAECGYTRYAWFNNTGSFSHFTSVCEPAVLRKFCDYLMAVNSRADQHYDVIALTPEAALSDVSLAEMQSARSQAERRK